MEEHLTDAELKAVYDLAKKASERELGPFEERNGTRIMHVIDELTMLRQNARMQDRRITELQTRDSELITENRVLRAKVGALEAILKHVLIENPVALAIGKEMGSSPGAAIRLSHDMLSLYQRVKLLEEYVTTKCVDAVKTYVSAARAEFGTTYVDAQDDNEAFDSIPRTVPTDDLERAMSMRQWVILFRDALK
jgi:predicted nuclease with TOPRIM domain